MDTDKSLHDVFRYSTDVERKKMLSKFLEFPEFNEENDLKTAILLDVYCEMVTYMVNNGFLCREVTSFYEIFQRMLNKIEGKSLVEAISMFQEELSSNGTLLHPSNLKSIIDYMFLTFFQHFKLYQFVLTQDRTNQITNLSYTVEPPPVAPPMREGFAQSIWDEQQRLKEIDQMERHRSQERTAQFEEEMQHAVRQLDDQLSEFESLPAWLLRREDLVAAVNNVTASKAAVACVSLSQKIHQIHDSLEFRYHRNNFVHEADKEDKKSASSGLRVNDQTGKK